MSKSPKRSRQVADVLRHQLAYILKKYVRDPRLAAVSITAVNVSPDLANAKIYFTLPDRKELKNVLQAFEKGTPFIRRQLADNIEMRYVPKLNFVYDKSIERGSNITALIDEALSKDQNNKLHDDRTEN